MTDTEMKFISPMTLASSRTDPIRSLRDKLKAELARDCVRPLREGAVPRAMTFDLQSYYQEALLIITAAGILAHELLHSSGGDSLVVLVEVSLSKDNARYRWTILLSKGSYLMLYIFHNGEVI